MATPTQKPAKPRDRGRLWLLLALLLFTTGALLAALHQKADPAPPRVTLPRKMDREARSRLEARRVLRGPRKAAAIDDAEPARPVRDPMIAALPPSAERAVVVIEANALRYTPVGGMLMQCLINDGDEGSFDRFKERSGLDPSKDIDRIAYADGDVLVSGFFDEARWSKLFPNSQPEKIDADTVLLARDDGRPIAVWKNQMLIVGQSRQSLQAVVDRLQGRTAAAAPVIAENESYGEIYGVLSPDLLTAVVPDAEPALAARLRAAATDVHLHVDASNDVGLVAEVRGREAQSTQDLAKALGAALVLARLRAKSAGDDDLAAALDYAAVRPSSGANFQLEVGLPIAMFERMLGACARKKPPALGRGTAAGLGPGRTLDR